MAVKILKVVCISVLAWFVVSYLDVIMHNMGSCQYQPWNVFELFAKSVLTNPNFMV